MLHKSTKVLTINHQMGKITLHAASSKESVLRVRKKYDGSLETLGREYGGMWQKDTLSLHPRFLKAIQDHLVKTNSEGYFYINHDVVRFVNRRFVNSRQ